MKSIDMRTFIVVMLAIFLLPAVGVGTLLFAQTNVGPLSPSLRLNSGGIYGPDLNGAVVAETIGTCSMTGNATVNVKYTVVGSEVSGDIEIVSYNTVDKIFGKFSGGTLTQAPGGFLVIEDGTLKIEGGIGKFLGISGDGGTIKILLKPFASPFTDATTNKTINGEMFVQMSVQITRVNT